MSETHACYPGDKVFLDALSGEERSQFEKYMADLDAAHAQIGSPYGEGSLWKLTGAECWYVFFEEGYSPAAALEKDLSYD